MPEWLGPLLVVLGIALAVQAVWREEPATTLGQRIREGGLPLGLILGHLGVLLWALPDFFSG